MSKRKRAMRMKHIGTRATITDIIVIIVVIVTILSVISSSLSVSLSLRPPSALDTVDCILLVGCWARTHVPKRATHF